MRRQEESVTAEDTSAAAPDADLSRLAAEANSACIEFLRDLVTLPSPSRGERLACERVVREMGQLSYQDVHVDGLGNVIGRFGSGPRILAFDAHIDTVGITNPARWRHDPFRGMVAGGTLYGRGASDQKGGLASVVHGIAIASRLGLPDDATVWVVASVNSEDCDGQAWQYILNETKLRPEVVVIAMPSHLGVCRGQRGRVEIEISVAGVSTHGSQPERGTNAVYGMCPIVSAIDRLHGSLAVSHPMLGKGSLAVTDISSRTPSLTAIPDECTIHLDRRLTIGESAEQALAELRQLPEVQAAGAEVRLLNYDAASWRGLSYPTSKVFPAWETAEDNPAVQAAFATAERVLGRQPRLHRSSFSSHGCATAGMFGIPTVGFGPADEVHSHTVNDQISLAQLEPAMAFYGLYPKTYLGLSDHATGRL
jgi:putative selenium metabolism hydrolase